MRVVCGLSETMASFVPTIRLSSVDLPAFGRPTKRDEARHFDLAIERSTCDGLRPCREAHADLVDAAALGFEHLDAQAVELERLADRRHAAELRQQVAADGLESLRLDLDAEPLAHLVDVRPCR